MSTTSHVASWHLQLTLHSNNYLVGLDNKKSLAMPLLGTMLLESCVHEAGGKHLDLYGMSGPIVPQGFFQIFFNKKSMLDLSRSCSSRSYQFEKITGTVIYIMRDRLVRKKSRKAPECEGVATPQTVYAAAGGP
ncbi:hypothetical protein RND71_033414 [Anisodus tanguticus]|uniref:Uncharacterized protein n=1 Tax=Anisodus tanguticus TaxID=243964 RepID=A0AAE1R7Q7_9SOLA|nr:hypothetical protein RND71_033414 [Anisodus tanguticus]